MPSDLTIYRDDKTLRVSRRAYEGLYRELGWSDMPATPNKSATKGEWVAFAVEHGGMQTEDAERLTRDDLVDRFHVADSGDTETSPSTDGDDQTGTEPENQEG